MIRSFSLPDPLYDLCCHCSYQNCTDQKKKTIFFYLSSSAVPPQTFKYRYCITTVLKYASTDHFLFCLPIYIFVRSPYNHFSN